MDVDPLEDTVPPRYAVESDEEDEYNPLETPSKSEPVVDWEIKLIGDIPKGRPLVVASGDAGKYWARGADLGEQTAGVYVNTVAVGLLFTPAWSQSTILVSEATTRLPISAIDPYVKKVAQELEPTSVTLLDVYPVPSYISLEPIPFYAAPIRYLSTGKVPAGVASLADALAPPNLLTTASASFIANFSASSPVVSTTALLLPLSRIPPPLPKSLAPSRLPSSDDDSATWPENTMEIVHHLLFGINGQDIEKHWRDTKNGQKFEIRKGRRGDVGDGGMYI